MTLFEYKLDVKNRMAKYATHQNVSLFKTVVKGMTYTQAAVKCGVARDSASAIVSIIASYLSITPPIVQLMEKAGNRIPASRSLLFMRDHQRIWCKAVDEWALSCFNWTPLDEYELLAECSESYSGETAQLLLTWTHDILIHLERLEDGP